MSGITKGLFARGLGLAGTGLRGLFARGLAETIARQYQRLLDGTAETISVAERLRFLRKLEDSQTPVIFIDRQGIKHLVHISKISLLLLPNQVDDLEELNVQVVCVDAGEGRWPQPKVKVRVSVGVTAVLA